MPRSFRHLLISLAITLAACGLAHAQTSEPLYRTAAKSYRNGNWEQAATLFEQAIPRLADSQKQHARFYLAECQLQLGRYSEALKYYQTLINSGGNKFAAKALFRAGEAAVLAGDDATAKQLLSKFLQSHADNPAAAYALRYLGDIAQRSGDTTSAIATYESILTRYPEFADEDAVAVALARLLIAQGRTDEAQKLVAKLDGKRSDLLAEALLLAGRATFEAHKYEASLEAFRTITHEYPDTPVCNRARIAAAWALWRLERFDEIDAEVSQLVNNTEWISDYHYLRGMAAYGSEYWARGASHLAKAAAYRPDHPSHDAILFYQGLCYLRNDQASAARSLFERLSVEHPNSAWRDDALWELARLAREEQDQNEYQSTVDELQAVAPASDYITSFYDAPEDTPGEAPAETEPKNNLAEAQQLLDEAVGLERDGRTHSAISAYQELLRQPAGEIIYEGLWRCAKLYSRMNRHHEAASLYQRLLEELPNSRHSAEALSAMANAQLALGNRPAAREHFQILLENFPQSAQAAPAAYWLAQAAADESDSEQASQYCHAALELLSKDESGANRDVQAKLVALLCRIAAEQGDWNAVLAETAKTTLEPQPLEISFWSAEAKFRLGEYDLARSQFEKLAVRTIGHFQEWTAMVPLRQAQLAAQRQQWNQVIELAGILDRQYPNFELRYEVDYLRGRALAGRGEMTEARRYYREVLGNEDSSEETAAAAQWMIGETHFHQQNYESARLAYQALIDRNAPADWRARAALQAGKCWELEQNWDQAQATYADAIERWPNAEPQPQLAARLKWAEGHATTRR